MSEPDSSADWRRRYKWLISQATGQSDADVAMLLAAIDLADTHQRIGLGLDARLTLLDACNYAGRYELMLPAFSWCLSQVDRDEKLRDRHYHSLLWQYKYMIEALVDFHQVTRGQIEGVIRDMQSRYTVQGYGISAVEYIQVVAAMSLGDAGFVRERLDTWVEAPRDSMSDCAACVLHRKVQALLFLGEMDAAVEASGPLVERKVRCISKPEMTYCWLLIPMLKLGRYDTAAQYHSLSLPKVLKTPNFMDDIAHHLTYLALTGQFSKALRIFESGANWLVTMRRGLLRLTFLQNAIILFERLAAATSNAQVGMRLAEELPFHRQDGLYVPATLAGQLVNMESELRESFNVRNGNTYLTSRFDALRSDVAQIIQCLNPLRPEDIPEQSSP